MAMSPANKRTITNLNKAAEEINQFKEDHGVWPTRRGQQDKSYTLYKRLCCQRKRYRNGDNVIKQHIDNNKDIFKYIFDTANTTRGRPPPTKRRRVDEDEELQEDRESSLTVQHPMVAAHPPPPPQQGGEADQEQVPVQDLPLEEPERDLQQLNNENDARGSPLEVAVPQDESISRTLPLVSPIRERRRQQNEDVMVPVADTVRLRDIVNDVGNNLVPQDVGIVDNGDVAADGVGIDNEEVAEEQEPQDDTMIQDRESPLTVPEVPAQDLPSQQLNEEEEERYEYPESDHQSDEEGDEEEDEDVQLESTDNVQSKTLTLVGVVVDILGWCTNWFKGVTKCRSWFGSNNLPPESSSDYVSRSEFEARNRQVDRLFVDLQNEDKRSDARITLQNQRYQHLARNNDWRVPRGMDY